MKLIIKYMMALDILIQGLSPYAIQVSLEHSMESMNVVNLSCIKLNMIMIKLLLN